jgi:hypothetical protein
VEGQVELWNDIVRDYFSILDNGIDILLSAKDLVLTSSLLWLAPNIVFASLACTYVVCTVLLLSIFVLPIIAWGLIFIDGGLPQTIFFTAAGSFCLAGHLRSKVLADQAKEE